MAVPYFWIRLNRRWSRGDKAAYSAVAVRPAGSVVAEGSGVAEGSWVGVPDGLHGVALGLARSAGIVLVGRERAVAEFTRQADRNDSMPKPRTESPARRRKSRRVKGDEDDFMRKFQCF